MRRLVFNVLLSSEQQHIFVNNFLKDSIEFQKLKKEDQSLAYNIIYGVLQNKSLLDYQINKFLAKPKRLNNKARIILQMVCYQALFLDKVPAHAICSEAVKLAKMQSLGKLVGLINAVSRKITKLEKDDLALPEKNNIVKYLSIKYSHPDWLVTKWVKQLGRDLTEEILIANNTLQDTTIRVNPSKTSLDEVKYELERLNITYKEGRLTSSLALTISSGDIFKSELFNKGFITIQDQGAIKACLMLDVKKKQRILDMCSAPGGKTALIANLLENDCEIVALDINPNRLKLLSETCYRMGVENVKAMLADARKITSDEIGKFDRVLLDAPCTGLGTIRTKPEIRWYRKPRDIVSSAVIQKEMLRNGLKLLKDEGIMVYVTCSNEIEETIEVIDEMEKVDVVELTQLYPSCYETEGFFIAKLKHKEGKN